MRFDRSDRLPIACVVLVLALVTSGACGGDLLFFDGTTRVTGDWNGRGASLSLDASGGSIEYDCAHGGLSEPARPDRAGRFDVSGVFVLEHGGPIYVGEVPDSLPARYIGVFRDKELSLSVVVDSDTLGRFTLVRDGPARLFKCL